MNTEQTTDEKQYWRFGRYKANDSGGVSYNHITHQHRRMLVGSVNILMYLRAHILASHTPLITLHSQLEDIKLCLKELKRKKTVKHAIYC